MSNFENGIFSEKLLGEHMFSGIQNYVDCGKGGRIIFTIDGITYGAYEDPDDGYRSYLGDIVILKKETPSVTFEPQRVVITGYEDGIQILNIKTGNPILEIYTDYSDKWYPCCIFRYSPENMEINERRA